MFTRFTPDVPVQFWAVLTLIALCGAIAAPVVTTAEVPVIEKISENAAIRLSVLGVYESRIFDSSAAEIPTYDPQHKQLFGVKATDAALDVLDLADPTAPALKTTIDLSAYGTDAQL